MRILLADNQAKVRFALRVLLERQPGLEVVDEAASSEQVAAQASRSCPDLILLDWAMVSASGSDLLQALRRDCPGLGIIILSGRPEARKAALAAGADAFVSKGNPPEALLAAIARLCRDGGAPAMGNLTAAEAQAL
ncbi:MAG: response regulator transcription factor [Anaerolineae bacterium]|jgi:DNA-binding NarL/FixJ family response regulator